MPGPSIRTLLDATAPNKNSKMRDAITREGFQIGTNRPTPSTRRRSPGFLVDMRGCFAKSFTVATLGSSTARGLMRSIHYKHYALSDLEWLVVPPMLSGQCAVMEATAIGKKAPVAVALWASASDEVDKRLSENLNIPISLRPDEWRFGDVLWLVDAVGEANAIPHLLRQVQETVFHARDVKMRTLDANARPTVRLLNSAEPANGKGSVL